MEKQPLDVETPGQADERGGAQTINRVLAGSTALLGLLVVGLTWALLAGGGRQDGGDGGNGGGGDGGGGDGDANQECTEWPQRVDWNLDSWMAEPDDLSDQLLVPSLTLPTYNMALDVHATASAKDLSLIFSSGGAWHLPVRTVLEEVYFPDNPGVNDSYLFTTNPPVVLAQMSSGKVKTGNIMYTDAQPHILVGWVAGLLDLCDAQGYLTGERIELMTNYGQVILKRKGDTTVNTFWDLRNLPQGRFATAHIAESSSYLRYERTILNVALNNPRVEGLTQEQIEQEAEDLRAHLLADIDAIGAPMHRALPHAIATGQADAGLMMHELAVAAMNDAPGVFSAVWIASDKTGEVDTAEELALGQTPLEGNEILGPVYMSRTSVEVTEAQSAAREALIASFTSDAARDIMIRSGVIPSF